MLSSSRGKTGDPDMRIALLIVAALALVGFLVVAVVMPRMAGADAKEAAQALIAGAGPAQQQVGAAAEKRGKLEGSGEGVKIAPRNDSRHGEIKWLVSESRAIRGRNAKDALQVTFTPSLPGGKASWDCPGD